MAWQKSGMVWHGKFSGTRSGTHYILCEVTNFLKPAHIFRYAEQLDETYTFSAPCYLFCLCKVGLFTVFYSTKMVEQTMSIQL